MEIKGYEKIWELKDPKWLLDPFIPENSKVLVHGHPGLGKSTMVLGWLTCLAHGVDWLDYPTAKVPVLNVWVEGQEGDVKKRHKAALRQFGVVGNDNYKWLRTRVNLTDREAIERLAEELDRIEFYPKVFSFDSLHACTLGLEENDSKGFGYVLDNMDYLIDLFDAAVLGVHHPTKASKKAPVERGSSAIKGGFDVQIAVVAAGQGVLKVVADKNRGGEDFAIKLKRQQVSTPWGPTVTTVDIREPDLPPVKDIQDSILSALVDGPKTTKELIKVVKDRSRSALYRDLKDLEALGEVTSTKHGTWGLCPKGVDP